KRRSTFDKSARASDDNRTSGGGFMRFRISFAVLLAAILQLPGANASAYAPPAELITSPGLLLDYVSWDRADRAFNAAESETHVYRDLVEIAYDEEIQRPWEAEYFP